MYRFNLLIIFVAKLSLEKYSSYNINLKRPEIDIFIARLIQIATFSVEIHDANSILLNVVINGRKQRIEFP